MRVDPHSIDEVVDALALTEQAPDVFAGEPLCIIGGDWAFGGMTLAQSLVAAGRTGDGRLPRSVHTTFAHRGDPETPVVFRVRRVGDQRAFAYREVRAVQADAVLATSVVVLHEPDDEAPSHQEPAPSVPAPDAGRADRGYLPVQLRDVSDPPLFSRQAAEPTASLWYRSPGVDTDPYVNAALICFLSDLNLADVAWRPVEGLHIADQRRTISSTISATCWFHDVAHFGEWHLVHATSPAASGGRALVRGDWFEPDGSLVASCALDCLMRVRRDPGATVSAG